MHSVKVDQLVRNFGNNVAVDKVSFKVKPGEYLVF